MRLLFLCLLVGCDGASEGTDAGEEDDVPLDAAPSAPDQGDVGDVGGDSGLDAADARVADAEEISPDAALREGLAPIGRVDTERFATSPACSECHTNTGRSEAMRDRAGRPVSQFDLWRSSMMANAARDPLWRAVVAAEVAGHPELAAEIEAKCLRCHAPMAVYDTPQRMEVLDGDGPDSLLGLDGVSCTVCHQIQEEGLGAPESWSGGFVIGDEREINALHEDLRAEPMELWTGFRPVLRPHQRRPELCATCHTLYNGAGFAEQTPYLEWQHAQVAQTCQGCHVPQTDWDGEAISTQAANTRGGTDDPELAVRSPFGRHLFVGGNTLMLSILRDQADWLRPNAPPEAFDATIAATRQQLTERAATLAVQGWRAGDAVEVTVTVGNLAGHKLPTGYPSRRVWVRVEVRDVQGAVRFLSGDFDEAGRLLGPTGAPLLSEQAGGPIEPHRDRVGHGEVQVYEAVMADAEGAPSFSVLDARAYVKDDRLLPTGWRPNPPADIAPVGVDADPDFGPTDVVHYRIEDVVGPVEIRVTLLYQTVSGRFIAELAQVDVPEVRRFLDFYEQADRRPVAMREVVLTVD